MMTEQILQEARERLVDELGGEILAESRDAWGRHGWIVRVGGQHRLLIAKTRRYNGRISVSKPALAKALERDLDIVIYDRESGLFRLFDPEWVREHGIADVVESKKTEIGVRDVPPGAGDRLDQEVLG